MKEAIAVVVLAAGFFFGGYYAGKGASREAAAVAIAAAHEKNLKRNDEVVNGWAAAVTDLRRRLRDGQAPRIPVPGTPGTPDAPGRPDGGAADDLPDAGKLETCSRERARLIEDCAVTTIQLKGLQSWAR